MNAKRAAEMLEDVIERFMKGTSDGMCPFCGKHAEACDSDEGPGNYHWLERYYKCPECGGMFTERFDCVPKGIWPGWDGRPDCDEVEAPPEKPRARKLVKVNLPGNRESYEHGNGEGCFAYLIGDAARDAYEADAEGGQYEAILDNDSLYYPGLMHGVTVPVEMRGTARPVVPYIWLQANYGRTRN